MGLGLICHFMPHDWIRTFYQMFLYMLYVDIYRKHTSSWEFRWWLHVNRPLSLHLVNSVTHLFSCHCFDFGEGRCQARVPQAKCFVWSGAFPLGCLVALGSFSDSTRSLNQCTYMMYDNLSKSDSTQSLVLVPLLLHLLQWLAKRCNRRRAEQHSPALGMWSHFNNDVSAYLTV